MRRLVPPFAFLIVFCAAAISRADDDAAFGRPTDGHITLTFTDRSDLSTAKETGARMGKLYDPDKAAEVAYKLPDESFEVYLPKDYTGEKPYGLFVFISPSGNGKPPRQWLASMDEHHLIWCGPNKAGNDRFAHLRMGLAIDAAYNMKKKYNIDPQRVYAAGVSGGGRVASMLGVCFSDIFTGGYYMVGCNFYRQEKVPDSNEVYFRSYNVPPTKIFVQAKKNKHVFLTGDTDGNRVQTQLYYEGFKHDGFEHITYIQVPGMGHGAPNPEWFEKGLKALDEPLPVAGTVKATTTQRVTTRPTSPAATQSDDPATVAKQLLATARLYLDNKQLERGREKLKWIVDHYPGTPAAAEAQKLLNQPDASK